MQIGTAYLNAGQNVFTTATLAREAFELRGW